MEIVRLVLFHGCEALCTGAERESFKWDLDGWFAISHIFGHCCDVSADVMQLIISALKIHILINGDARHR